MYAVLVPKPHCIGHTMVACKAAPIVLMLCCTHIALVLCWCCTGTALAVTCTQAANPLGHCTTTSRTGPTKTPYDEEPKSMANAY